MNNPGFTDLFRTLCTASGQSRTARTVELFGWFILFEGGLMLLAPQVVVSILRLPELVGMAENLLRLVGLLAGGVGMLYIVSGRMNALGFAFASLLDRPLVPPIMAVLWWLGIMPGSLALAFSIQDFAGFLWTLLTWRAERGADRATDLP